MIIDNMRELADDLERLEDAAGWQPIEFVEDVTRLRMNEYWNLIANRRARISSQTSWFTAFPGEEANSLWRRESTPARVQEGRFGNLLHCPTIVEADGQPSSFLTRYGLSLEDDNGKLHMVLLGDIDESELLEPASDLPNLLNPSSDF